MRLLQVLSWVCMLTLLGGPVFSSDRGEDIRLRLEAIQSLEKNLIREEKAKYRDLARLFIEKRIPTAADESVGILAALGEEEAVLAEAQKKITAMGSGNSSLRLWGKEKLKKSTKGSLKAWEGLLKRAGRSDLWSTRCRIAGIIVSIRPGHAAARKTLGQRRFRGRWMGAFEIAKLKKGRTWTRTWGYVSSEEQRKLEKGLRPLGGAWVPREEEEKVRRSWSDVAVFETEWLTVRSVLPFDASLAFFTAAHRAQKRIRSALGDFFELEAGRSANVYLARDKKDSLAILRKLDMDEALAEQVSFYYPDNRSLVVRRDLLQADGAFRLPYFDPLARDLVYWLLMEAKRSGPCEKAGYWAFMGAAILAETHNLDKPRWDPKIERFRWFPTERAKYPEIADIIGKAQDEFIQIPRAPELAFCMAHYFYHHPEAKMRIRFLIYLRNYTLGLPLGGPARILELDDPQLRSKVLDYIAAGLQGGK